MRLFLIGGFLGSGKTTAIQKACTLLLKRGVKVGVVTNDQGEQLVDNRFIKSFGIPSEEVVNGCFCCNFNQLKDSLDTLTAEFSPDVIFAESVGSCTDLIATVVKPLVLLDPGQEIIVSVFVDARVLPTMIKGSRLFSDSVNYIYRKQMEEADVLVVNKIDLLSSVRRAELNELVAKTYPGKKIVFQNSLDTESIKHWLELLADFNIEPKRRSLELDYEVYGAGEAALAWLDHEVRIVTTENNAGRATIRLINKIYSKITGLNLPIGHLKFQLDNGEKQQKISFTSINYNEAVAKLEIEESRDVRLLINARVQSDSELLYKVVEDAKVELMREEHCTLTGNVASVFHPSFPKPVHRVLN